MNDHHSHPLQATASSPLSSDTTPAKLGIALYEKGLAEHEAGQLDRAEESYRQALEVLETDAPNRLYIYNNLGCILAGREQFDGAMAVYQAALKIDPDFPPLHNNLGRFWQLQGNLDRAVEAYRRALELAPDNSRSYNNLGQALQQQNHHAEALAYFQCVLQIDGDRIKILGDCARAALECGEVTQALEYLHRALGQQPDWVNAYCERMAQIVPDNDLDRMRQASGQLLDALRQNPNDSTVRQSAWQSLLEVFFYRGRVQFQAGWIDRAVRDYGKAKALKPEDPQIEAGLQTCAIEQQRLKTRELDYDRGSPLPPELPRGVYRTTQAWWAASGLDERHYIQVDSQGEDSSRSSEHEPEEKPSRPDLSDPPCPGVNCDRCLRRISRQFEVRQLETGIWHCPEGDVMPSPETFVATIPEGRVWMMPQENWWQVCEAIAIISPDNHLLADVSREYPGQLPGCDRHQPRQHRIFRAQNLPPLQRVRGTVAVVGGLSANVYFHWMVDVLPRLDLLRRSDLHWEEIDYFLFNEIPQPFARESLKKLGIPESKILQSDRYSHLVADRLVVPSFPDRLGWLSPRSLHFLRRTFLPPQPTPTPTPERLYISRANARYRRLFNETETIALLETFGFVSVRLEEYTLNEQVLLFSRAKIIVAPHGSGLTNIIFCEPGTQIIELVSPHYIRHYFSAICRQCGLKHYAIAAETLQCTPLRQWIYPSSLAEDILIDLEILRTFLTKYVKIRPTVASPFTSNIDCTPLKPMPVSDRSSSPALHLYDQAQLRFDRKELDAALTICQEALKVDANFPPTNKLMGNILLARGQVEEAKKYYLRAIELKPNYGEAYANLGSLAARQKDWKASIAYYQKAIAFQPDLAVAHRNLAKVWQKLGKDGEAINCLYSAYELEPKSYKPEEHLNLGNTLFEQGQLSQAIACYQRALKLNPRLVGAYQNLAEALTRQGRFQDANNYYRHLVRQNLTQPKLPAGTPAPSERREIVPPAPMAAPGNSGASSPLVPTSALPTYPVNPETSPWLALAAYEYMGRVLESQQEVNRAYKHLGEAIQRHETLYEEGVRYRETVRQLATGMPLSHAEGSETGGLRRWFSSLVGFLSGAAKAESSSSPMLPPAYIDRRSETTHQLALGSTQSMAQEYVETGNTLLGHGEIDRAIRCYQRAINLSPNFPEAYERLGDALSKAGRVAEAAMYARQARELSATSLKYEGTIETEPTLSVNGALKMTPVPLVTDTSSEEIIPLFDLSGLGATTVSEPPPIPVESPYLEKTAEPTVPPSPAPTVKVISPKPTQASAEPGHQDRVAAYLRLGELYIQQKNWDEAIETYRQASELDPQLWQPRERLGDIAAVREQWEDAERWYRSVLEIEPTAWQIHNKLGDLLQAQGKLDEAILAYRQAAGLNGSSSGDS